jgi:hypothetical protein
LRKVYTSCGISTTRLVDYRQPAKRRKASFAQKRGKKILWFCLFVLLVIFFAFLLLFLSPVGPLAPSGNTIALPTRGRIVYLPYLVIQISPPGYPVAGTEWKINVYEVDDLSSGVPILKPATNSTVTVNLISSGKEALCQLRTDENGEAVFTYRPEFTDIAFQARTGNNTLSA